MIGDVDNGVGAAGIGDLTKWPTRIAAEVNRAVDEWEEGAKVGRLWAGDATLWTGTDEAQWLGWLRILDEQRGSDELETVSAVALAGAFDDVLVLGMGGSSLCPEVLGLSFGRLSEAPRLHVLDSTDPSQIRACTGRLALDRTLFIVSSKSGTTLESNILMRFFFDRVSALAPPGTVGERFVAVTDPGWNSNSSRSIKGFGRSSMDGRVSAVDTRRSHTSVWYRRRRWVSISHA